MGRFTMLPATERLKTLHTRVVLGSLLLLASFMISCSAADCRTFIYTCRNDSTPGCTDEYGVMHALNSTWTTKNCENCTCTASWMKCCNIVFMPLSYNMTKCRAIFHQDNCTYSVVEREDPAKHCDVDVWTL